MQQNRARQREVNSYPAPPDVELQQFTTESEGDSLSNGFASTTPLKYAESNELPIVGQEATRTPSQGFFNRLRRNIRGTQQYKYLSADSASGHSRSGHFRGWRNAVLIAAAVTGAVLVLNIVLTIVAMVKYGATDGVGTIYFGDCKLVKRWNTALHLVINILGTCLLAASSFTMQCLSSPTRSEVDAAHAKRKSLDIGLPSLKNLFYIGKWKVFLWWSLSLSTLPLHLLWNSTVFSTLGANEFGYIVVTESFLSGAPYATLNESQCLISTAQTSSQMCRSYTDDQCGIMSTVPSIYDAYRAGNYSDRMTPSECISAYSKDFITERRNLIAVTSAIPREGVRMSPACGYAPHKNLTELPANASNMEAYYYSERELLGRNYIQPLWNESSVLAVDFASINTNKRWLCYGWDDLALDFSFCDGTVPQDRLKSNGTWYLRPDDRSVPVEIDAKQGYPIDYCYSEKTGDNRCQLHFLSYIMYVVIICNAIKAVVMGITIWLIWDIDEPIFATVGDAVVSYMERPDPTTKHWCLMSLDELDAWRAAKDDERPKDDCFHQPRRKNLFSTISRRRWWATIAICIAYLVLAAVLLQASFNDHGAGQSHSQILSAGIGTVLPDLDMGISGQSGGQLIKVILFANCFQVALSTTYFLYNALYTAQCSSLEWSSYANGQRKPLRVTWPRGQQLSTLYLQLPYHYSIPLTLFLMLMHFLISQSIFLARVQWFDVNGNMDIDNYISKVSYSPVAILITICVGILLVVVQIAHSFLPYKNCIPAHGNSSAAISAACHNTPEVGDGQTANGFAAGAETHKGLEGGAAQKEVMWGAVKQPLYGDDIGHCGFTDMLVEQPVDGQRYR